MAAPGENLRINSDRLWDSIMEMAKIGPGVAGGNNRQTLTDTDGEGRQLFKGWCEAAGLEMGLDEMGTMFARREGTEPDLPPVYVGSMARGIELVHEIAMDYQPDAVGAVGHMEVYPNSRNIIAGRTMFTIDIRSPEKEVLDAMDGRIREGIDTICEALDIQYQIDQVGHFDPVTFDPGCVKAVRDAAERLGYTHRNIVSGAGHDACWINRVAPTAMVMCPCVDGLSHNEAEEITKEWAAAGADVLFHAVVETAVIVG
ncbi:MAG: M20/M25/M40 family metallo-hydrolase [Mesorhizobium sp.]|nr:MAG: M20/M25/M40 family metallo-hydrolase [Mesorhizobium sp.]